MKPCLFLICKDAFLDNKISLKRIKEGHARLLFQDSHLFLLLLYTKITLLLYILDPTDNDCCLWEVRRVLGLFLGLNYYHKAITIYCLVLLLPSLLPDIAYR